MERQKKGTKRKWFLGLAVWSMVFGLLLVSPTWSEEKEGEVTSLEEIVVTATRTPHLVKDLPVSVTVVNRTEIEDSKAEDVGEVLNTLPGVKINSYGSMGSVISPSIRGSSAEQTLILLDGKPLNLGASGLYDLSLISIEMVERIEVLRGPASALYGANALGGVINIITRNIPEKPPFFTSHLQYGSFNTTLLSFCGGRKFERFGYLLGGQYNYSDGDRENSGDEENHFFGKFTWDLNKNSSLTLSSGFDRQDLGVPGSTVYGLTPLAIQKTTGDWQDILYNFVGERGEFTARLYFNHNKLHYQNPAYFTDSTIKNGQTGFEVQQNYSPNETHLLTLGGNYIKDEVRSESTGDHAPEREAFFIQDQITFGKATLVLGGRVDDHSVYGTEFSPRIAARYALSEDTTLRSSLGKAYRAPTVNELYWYEDWGWGAGMFGNKDLKPEKGINYDLGVEHKFSKDLSATITYFRNDVKDLISWVDMGWWRYETQNIGKARLQGVETELKWVITKCLSFSVNHTYLNAEDRNTGKKLLYRPENRVGSLLSYAHPSGFKVQVEGEYNDVSYANPDNTNKVDDYFLLSLVVSKKISPRVELFAKGKNLFGEEYEIIDGFPMPQTTVTVGLKASF